MAKATSPDDLPRRFPSFLSAAVRDALLDLARAQPDAAWQPGRQGTGYEKLDLRESGLLEREAATLEPVIIQARSSFRVEYTAWDAYFLRYRDGAHVPDHTDPTGPQRHLRLNAIIANAAPGTGELRFEGRVVELADGDAVCFRPDRIAHRVSAVSGERYVFSVGCVY